MIDKKLGVFLERKVKEFNRPSFIEGDPVQIPHLFSLRQDREIAGLFTAVFAWGIRTTIINKSRELLARMDNQPYQFVLHAGPADLKRLLGFKHRTFNDTDLLYFVEFLHHHYQAHDSLEAAFVRFMKKEDEHIGGALRGFHHYFFSLEDAPRRTVKHISTPAKNSTCKRLCMFLRWMVRHDSAGVDLGIWNQIKPAQLILPVDLHVTRVTQRMGLLDHTKPDWNTAVQLTRNLKELDPNDPVKFDYALFGLGVLEKFR